MLFLPYLILRDFAILTTIQATWPIERVYSLNPLQKRFFFKWRVPWRTVAYWTTLSRHRESHMYYYAFLIKKMLFPTRKLSYFNDDILTISKVQLTNMTKVLLSSPSLLTLHSNLKVFFGENTAYLFYKNRKYGRFYIGWIRTMVASCLGKT